MGNTLDNFIGKLIHHHEPLRVDIHSLPSLFDSKRKILIMQYPAIEAKASNVSLVSN